MLEISTLIVLAVVGEVHSYPRAPETVTTLEVWNPFTWWIPFGIAQAESWSNYLKETQRASNRLYGLIRRYIRAGLLNRVISNGNRVKDQGFQKQNRTTATRAAEDVAPGPEGSTGEDTHGIGGEKQTTGEISSAGHWK